MNDIQNKQIINQIELVVKEAQSYVVSTVNIVLLKSYLKIGEIICDSRNVSLSETIENTTAYRYNISMELIDILNYKNVSQYRLAKLSDVPQTTISDICSNKTSIEKCSVLTLYKISKALNISVEDFIVKQCDLISPLDFDVFKSSVCHLYKTMSPNDFVNSIISSNDIETFFNKKEYAKSFYLIAMVDYVSDKYNIPAVSKYDYLRSFSLLEPLYPNSIIVLDNVMHTNKNKKESLKASIPQFLKFNIIESEIDNVV